jgi:hypothetical protein
VLLNDTLDLDLTIQFEVTAVTYLAEDDQHDWKVSSCTPGEESSLINRSLSEEPL